jgi:hypothetical protein
MRLRSLISAAVVIVASAGTVSALAADTAEARKPLRAATMREGYAKHNAWEMALDYVEAHGPGEEDEDGEYDGPYADIPYDVDRADKPVLKVMRRNRRTVDVKVTLRTYFETVDCLDGEEDDGTCIGGYHSYDDVEEVTWTVRYHSFASAQNPYRVSITMLGDKDASTYVGDKRFGGLAIHTKSLPRINEKTEVYPEG